MEKSIRVQVLGRAYSLIVQEDDETLAREIAAYVDSKMQAFRREHPEQPEVTAAVVTALAVAEELYTAWEEQDRLREEVDSELNALAKRLGESLTTENAFEAAPSAERDGE
jgi:cell division protein ZapA